MFGDFEWQAQRKMRRAEISKYAKTTRTFRRTVKVAALKTHTDTMCTSSFVNDAKTYL